MAVLMTNGTLGVRRRIEAARNSHGERVRGGWSAMLGPEPGRAAEGPDATWSLGVDPGLWPVREGDLIVATSGQYEGVAWLVQSSDLLQNNVDHRVDWIRVSGLRRGQGGTTPADGWFVARYADGVDEDPIPINTPLAGTFTGHGPPPDDLQGEAGDEYVDLDTGIVYEFEG